MKRNLLWILVLALLVALAAPAMAQDEGSTLRIALQQEPDTLNAYYSSMWFATTVMDLVHAQNWVIDNNLNAVPVIAEEIPSAENGGLSEDGKTITFKIREGAVWSDGTPITANDFVFTYEMIMSDSNTPASRDPFETSGATFSAADDSTVVITTPEPYAPWLSKFALLPLPEHILRPVFESDGTIDAAAWNREPDVVSGPYKFVSWEAGSGMNFTRNENYFLKPAKIENVSVLFVPDDATVVSALVAGDTDVGTFIAAGDTPALEATGNINIELVASGYNEGLFFNMGEGGHPALQDVNVRRALAMLVDRDTINADLNLGINTTGSSFWEQTPFQRENAEPIPYDPEGAAALLDEAGWVDSNGDGTRDKDGTELVLRYVTNQRQVRKDVQAVVQQSFADNGVGVELLNFESDVFFADYANGGPMSIGEYDLGEYSAAPAFPDPDTVRFTCGEIPSDESPSGSNDSHFCDPALDELFVQQAGTVDPEARIEIFHQIDQFIADQVIWVNMWYDPDLWAINSRISNTNVSGADPLWNIANWEITG